MQSYNITKRTLMGPGPSDVHPRILSALSKPTIGHLDPQFITMMDEIKSMLQYAFQTKNSLTMAVSAPGSAGMETCFVNLIEPGDKVVVCINGVFGNRMKENVERYGGECIVINDTWGEVVNPQKVEDTLKQHSDAKILAFVHAETSTGAQSDAKTLCEIARKYDCLTIVDAVTSLAGSPLKVDEWGIDAIYSGTQKCLSCVPGLSPISLSDKAVECIKNRKTKVVSWFLDLSLVMAYWGDGNANASAPRSYHHTAPINALYGLHEALVLLKEEGLENAWKRHWENHLLLKNQLEEMGMEFVVKEGDRLPQLNSVWIPQGKDDGAIRKRLLNEYNIEIGAGLADFAGKVWRIGLMGYASHPTNVLLVTSALKNM
jgi:alanine-glyoxylate transaminase/serine-glyoxylate transaminase/serine-pyruvate transaminase